MFGATASRARPNTMMMPAAATNGRRLPILSERMPLSGLEMARKTVEMVLAARMVPMASFSPWPNFSMR